MSIVTHRTLGFQGLQHKVIVRESRIDGEYKVVCVALTANS